MKKRMVLLWAVWVGAQAARAQDAMPVMGTGQPAPAGPPAIGTTVLGEHDSPLGLYIMPWRNSAAEDGPNRPARLLDQALLPHDADVFHREFMYYRALSEHLEKNGRVTP